MLGAIVGEYETAKRARARLDFDDLVTRTAALFGDQAQGAWVRYKLDAGITHILVDESQDTNPEQWKVVDALAEEFFAGEGAAQRPRSLFAVGDPKQSIFSFQGAEPALFAESGETYRQKADAAGRTFRHMPMAASFRTLQAVLDAVDRSSCRGRCARRWWSARPMTNHHQRPHPFRAAAWRCGRVIEAEAGGRGRRSVDAARNERDAQEPASSSWPNASPTTIADWIGNGRALGQRGRAIRADDVLILVQSRNALFHEIIRALKKRGLPTPGADRLECRPATSPPATCWRSATCCSIPATT